jgi:hypothetical protein
MHATIHVMPAHAYELMIDTTSQQLVPVVIGGCQSRFRETTRAAVTADGTVKEVRPTYTPMCFGSRCAPAVIFAGAEAAPAKGASKALQALLASELGRGHKMRPFDDTSKIGTLQRMFSEIITDQARFQTTPQCCAPENIRVESVAGTGAFAVVYRGRLDVSDTLVAVKVMPIEQDMDSMTLVRNATELAALSNIRHLNIVQIIAQFPECVRPALSGS